MRSRVHAFGWSAAAVLCAALWLCLWKSVGGALLHPYLLEKLRSLTPPEIRFYLAILVAETALAGALLSWRGAGVRLEPLFARPRVTYVVLGVLAAEVALAIAWGVFGLHSQISDEEAYLFQAKLLLMGKLSVGAPPMGEAFAVAPLVMTPNEAITGQYFWAQPALLVPGVLVGLPHAVAALELGFTVWMTGLLGEEYGGEAKAGVFAALLAATCPVLLLTGATLHNANLAASCAVASLWALSRLLRRRSLVASLVLGLSVAVGLHNRPLDHAALVGAAGLLLVVCVRRAREIAARLAPSLLFVVPALALHLFINLKISGHPLHSAYRLLNDVNHWTTFGFGTGAFGVANTPRTAVTKTLANIAHVVVYATGAPIVPLAAAFCMVRRRMPWLVRVPLVLVVFYFACYALYAGVQPMPTGPVYFVAATPALLVFIALVAVRTSDRASAWPSSVWAAGLASALVFFWPTVLLEELRAAAQSSMCQDTVERSGATRALVFAISGERSHSWQSIPMASPTLDDPVLYTRGGPPEWNAKVARAFGRDRQVLLARCVRELRPELFHYAPSSGRVWPFGAGLAPAEREETR